MGSLVCITKLMMLTQFLKKCVSTAGVECLLSIGVELHRREGLQSIMLPHLVNYYVPLGGLYFWRGLASKA